MTCQLTWTHGVTTGPGSALVGEATTLGVEVAPSVTGVTCEWQTTNPMAV